MAKGKLILICQSGGEFVTHDDGTLSYDGGEANAVNISNDTLFDDLRLKLAEMCNLEHTSMSIKYFLPGNRRVLITLKNDKDLKRMIEYHGNSVTADIFVSGREGFDCSTLKIHSSSGTGVKLAETVNHAISVPVAYSAGLDVGPHFVGHSVTVPVHVTSPTTPADSVVAGGAVTAESSSQDTSFSTPSDHSADEDLDYAPRVAAPVKATINSPSSLDTCGTPADTVKKRRRTASWKIGAHGPTIVAVADDTGETRSRKKRSHRRNDAAQDSDIYEEGDIVPMTDSLISSIAVNENGDLPENLVASWKNGITGVGQDFTSVKEFRETLQKYAIAHRFVYKLKKNDTNRASGRCTVEDCTWSISASWVPTAQAFRIKKFNNVHTCGGESWKSAHPAKNWLVSIIKDKLRDSPHHKPKDIANAILRDFGIKLKYTQVWRGMEDARQQLQGSYKDSYNQLPWFCERVVETNPGSFAKLITNDEKRLQSLFVSFHASIHGFRNGCRPLLFLEATSLRSKHHEILLTATAIDADDGFFPVAFAIVDIENDDNWRWFLDQLKSVTSTSRAITFVSDREKGLKSSVLEVFENAYHGYCMFHLLESFKANLKGPFHGDGRGVLPGLFLAAGHAVRLGGFKKFTEQIKQISSQAYDWIIQIEPECWSSLLFKGEPYNHITENVSDLYTKVLEEVRESPILQKIEALRCMMSKFILDRQMESSKWSTKLTPSKERRIQEAASKARSLKVLISSEVLFEVHDDGTHVVNIEKRDCTCLEWKDNGLPCIHAVAVCNYTGKSVYDYCPRHFTVDSFQSTYSEFINPVPGIDQPVEKENADVDSVEVLPPSTTCQQRKEQSKPEVLNKRTVTCTRCKEPGHNKASCKATIEV